MSNRKKRGLVTVIMFGMLFTNTVKAQEAVFNTAQPVGDFQANSMNRAMLTLPSNTEILVRMNEELSTKKNEEGDTFHLSVVHDVTHRGFIVIPQGTRAVGELVWRTGKGAFGKSGKLEIEVKYLEMGGQRVPLIGKFRQEGEGNTVATVAAVALVWVAAPFITGKTGRIPAGRELTVRTRDPFPIALPAGYSLPGPEAGPRVIAIPVASAAPQNRATETATAPIE